MQYQFGDQDLAATRLGEVARVFADSTREFVRQANQGRIGLAVDLGCGPGWTTRLLAEILDCETVVGLDASERFLAIASEAAAAGMRYLRHDVLRMPLPAGPADLLFCRFLLSHLPQPRSCVEAWARQLKPSGLLLIEEVEAIETTQAMFARYLKIVELMLRSQATELYVGPVLEELEDSTLLRPLSSRARRLAVSNRDAARMFSLNVPNWKDRAFIRENYEQRSIDDLERELQDAAGRDWGSDIT